MHCGLHYLIVKDFEKSVELYEKFLGIKVGDRCRSGNKFVEFYFDNECLSLMNESNLGLVLPEIGKTILSALLLDGTAISFEQKNGISFSIPDNIIAQRKPIR